MTEQTALFLQGSIVGFILCGLIVIAALAMHFRDIGR